MSTQSQSPTASFRPHKSVIRPGQTPRCKTCSRIVNQTEITSVKSFHNKTKSNYTCHSSSVIYLGICSSCDAVYVGGRSNKLRERMTGHRSAIDHQEDTPVKQLFSQTRHLHHPTVAISQSLPDDLLKKLTLERLWITRFRNNSDHLLNRNDGHDILQL